MLAGQGAAALRHHSQRAPAPLADAALPAANDRDQTHPPENGQTGFLKFLALG